MDFELFPSLEMTLTFVLRKDLDHAVLARLTNKPIPEKKGPPNVKLGIEPQYERLIKQIIGNRAAVTILLLSCKLI